MWRSAGSSSRRSSILQTLPGRPTSHAPEPGDRGRTTRWIQSRKKDAKTPQCRPINTLALAEVSSNESLRASKPRSWFRSREQHDELPRDSTRDRGPTCDGVARGDACEDEEEVAELGDRGREGVADDCEVAREREVLEEARDHHQHLESAIQGLFCECCWNA